MLNALQQNHWEFHTIVWQSLGCQIRAGILKPTVESDPENTILYLQGLSDSFINHYPFFNYLVQHGYSIVAFDYPGQGGSSGNVNQVRLLPPQHENSVASMAELVWQRFCPEQENINMVMGWSTGGLAAYELAHRQRTTKVVMMAPGLGIKKLLGGKPITKLDNLTSENYAINENPHLDPIKPKSPLLVPHFSTHLLAVERIAKQWKISPQVKGLVCLSGKNDSYVNPEKTREIIRRNAPHFEINQYPSALHEIDNEKASIRDVFYKDVAGFLAK